jgi:hypothetical protein
MGPFARRPGEQSILPMRKIALLALTAAAFASAAGTASADVPNAKVQTFPGTTQTYQVCDTPYAYGLAFAYGAWGDYIDGCTVRLTCPSLNKRPCTVISDASISAEIWGRDSRVTQNARMRIFATPTTQTVSWFRDRSCASAYSYCESTDTTTILPGQSASTQCNGVREHYTGAPKASNSCYITIRP